MVSSKKMKKKFPYLPIRALLIFAFPGQYSLRYSLKAFYKKNSIILAIAGIFIFASCSQQSSTRSSNKSSTTGWKYNTSKNGGFQVEKGSGEQILGPGLVFVEGGSFSMGRVEQDVMYDWNNIAKKVTISSFYIDGASDFCCTN